MITSARKLSSMYIPMQLAVMAAPDCSIYISASICLPKKDPAGSIRCPECDTCEVQSQRKEDNVTMSLMSPNMMSCRPIRKCRQQGGWKHVHSVAQSESELRPLSLTQQTALILYNRAPSTGCDLLTKWSG